MSSPRSLRPSAPLVGLLVAIGLAAVAMLVPAVTGWNVHVNHFPPLHADWNPRVGPGSLPALLIAGLAGWQAVPLAARLSWSRLLLLSFVVGLGWMLSLAFVDGSHGVSTILGTPYEYLRSAHRIHDVSRMLHEYVSRIPFSAAPRNWPVHLAGHPPGAVLFFIGLVRVGLGSGFAAGMVVTVVAATTAVAVLLVLRILGAEDAARRTAPFLVLGPAAIWQSVSADAMFAAVAAWGMVALAMAATRAGRTSVAGWSVLAGLLLGYCVMLSYGLPVLGLLALAVLWLARSWRPVPITALAALAVVLGFAALGFRWWDALPVLHDRYWAGIASRRPAAYWIWGDLAALVFSAGPLVGAAVAQAGARVRDAGSRVPATLVAAGLAMVLVADLSQMSKAEVERIWLPFVPWLLVGTALLPERWRRAGLIGQLATALLIQHLLSTGW